MIHTRSLMQTKNTIATTKCFFIKLFLSFFDRLFNIVVRIMKFREVNEQLEAIFFYTQSKNVTA
jgi:hypothetical protein